MAKQKSTKRALIVSVLSLLLCFAMLAGTTFAWFTDSVSSVNNIIVAGNLDVDVYYGDPAQKQSIEGVTKLFSAVTLWEPGAVAYENLTVANIGTLALKYQMTISFENENHIIDGGYALSDILMVGLVEGGLEKDATREEAIDAVTVWLPMEDFQLDGELAAKTNEETLGIVIAWAPSDEDNNYNVNNGKTTSDGKQYLHIDLGVTLVATQLTAEEDSFGDDYDKNAEYPIVVGGVLAPDTTDGLLLKANDVSVAVPAGAPAGSYKLSVTDYELSTDENGKVSVNANIDLQKDGQKVDDAVQYDVSIELDPMLDINSVYHKDEEITVYDYNKWTGVLSFKTTSFSPFSVHYTEYAEEVVVDEDNEKIQGGFFKGVNPATIDNSLLGDDSEYIAVDYVKDGVKYYAVSERATTIIVGDADDGGSGYTFENGNYPVVMINNNTLHENSVAKLNDFEHGTLYILPGTYKEQRRLDVVSSMDIVGLGDAEDIMLIKQGTTATASSHQHLINCNGAVERKEHIQVTIRNLYLDASVGNGKWGLTDNGAVQSIRMSKVKCYDLVIKDKGMASFYVNGKYDDRGAYMYVENCSTDITNAYNVVTTSDTFKFYYDNLTYGKGEYTTTSSYIKNQTLDWDDWDW